ncbi:hypothetical protein ACFVUS_16760 [Nocardia sp. NPDC058058]|uniref:hypothetical protein n=1 Tax=Nocardia sp. NPDC058058 TaxID=3346317 RepID=UPI0036DC6893
MGKKVSFGEAVTIDRKDGAQGLTVLRVDKGNTSDLDSLADSSKYAGKTPYYVRYRLTKASTSYNTTSYFAVYAGKKQLSELIFLPSAGSLGNPNRSSASRFDKCFGASAAEFDKMSQGQSLEGCTTFLAGSGVGTPDKVQWKPEKAVIATWQ